MTNKVTVLGCGPSAGIPLLGHNDGPFWGDCDPSESKNKRLRASVYVEFQGLKILIDTSPDMRQQMLTQSLYTLDCVLMSHFHADHCHGIDELRPIVHGRGRQPLPLYADETTLKQLRLRFGYLFQPTDCNYFQILEPRTIDNNITFENVKITVIQQQHGPFTSLGYRFGNFAYSTDFNNLDEKALEKLQGLDVWIVDCLTRKPNSTHNHLDLTLQWIELVKPKRAILTHMTYDLDYATLCHELPDHIRPAYDGMIIEF